MSDALSPRNGPWKKLVNSPGLAVLRPTAAEASGAIGAEGIGGVAKEGSGVGKTGFPLPGSQGGAACSPDSPGGIVDGAAFPDGKSSGFASSGVLDLASES